MIPQKYLVATLQFILLGVTALQAALAGGITETEVWQLAAFLLGSLVAIVAPLATSGPAWILKGVGAVGGAVLTAVVPFVTQGWGPEAGIIVVLAGLNALATYVGVDVRVSGVQEALADPAVDDRAVRAADPGAVQAAYSRAA